MTCVLTSCRIEVNVKLWISVISSILRWMNHRRFHCCLQRICQSFSMQSHSVDSHEKTKLHGSHFRCRRQDLIALETTTTTKTTEKEEEEEVKSGRDEESRNENWIETDSVWMGDRVVRSWSCVSVNWNFFFLRVIFAYSISSFEALNNLLLSFLFANFYCFLHFVCVVADTAPHDRSPEPMNAI